MDAWGLDFVFSGSQKAWMCPPGLLIAAVGAKAWTAHHHARFPRFFWDLTAAKRSAEEGMTPTTPPLTLLYAYHAALEMILAEGVEQVWQRHRALGELTRAGITSLGLELFADPAVASNTVTAFLPPPGFGARQVLERLRRDHDVEAQGGQAHLADAIIRFGHMGWAHPADLEQAIAALGQTVTDLTGQTVMHG
jgi:aspartate aminotransferase-like enzyme